MTTPTIEEQLPEKKTPRELWMDLKAQFLKDIKHIDEATEWQEVEPDWWLEMMEVQRLLFKRL